MSVLPENDNAARSLYHYIADGTVLDDAFYRSVDKPDSVVNASQYVNEHRAYMPAETANVVNDNDIQDDGQPEPNGNIVEEEEDFDEIWSKYEKNRDKFEANMKRNRTDKDFLKCLKKYSKRMNTLSKANPETLKREMYGFGKSIKNKNSELIPVQVTSISRRKHKHRGKGPSTSGRRVADVAPRSQMTLVGDDDDGIVYHSLPNQKKQKTKAVHSLSQAVSENRSNGRKH